MTRVLVLTTASRLRADWVHDLRQDLPWEAPEIVVVTVTRPAEPLPVARCLVVGASLRPGRAVRDARTMGAPRPAKIHEGRWAKLADRLLMRAPAARRKDRRLMLSTGTRWSREVRSEFASADIVIAHDFNTTWAAWLLARRIPGPHVVFQPEGVALKMAEVAGEATH